MGLLDQANLTTLVASKRAVKPQITSEMKVGPTAIDR
jgi:hypothetical protein